METRKRPSQEAINRFAEALAPYVAEILAKRKCKQDRLTKQK